MVSSSTPAPSTKSRDSVLHVRVVTGTGGGPEKTILLSATTDAALLRYDMTAAYMHPPGDPGFAVLERRARMHGCPLIDVPDRGALDPRPARQLLHACRKLNVRIWHGHDYKSNLFGLMLRPFHPMNLVTTMHGWVRKQARTTVYFAVDRFCLRYYDHVIAVSPELHAQARRLAVPAERCSLIPNGVDPRVYCRELSPAQSPLRREYGVPDERFLVGTVGRLSAEKGVADLIAAVRALVAEGIDLELWIAGEGDARTELEATVAAAQLQDRVRFLGYVEDVVALLHALDVFVLSSVREGMPNTLLEALSMNVPVVATNVGGVSAVVENGQNGLLCAAGDPAALAQSIRRLFADRELRDRLTRAGRRTIEERFTFAARAAQELAIYDRLLGRSS